MMYGPKQDGDEDEFLGQYTGPIRVVSVALRMSNECADCAMTHMTVTTHSTM